MVITLPHARPLHVLAFLGGLLTLLCLVPPATHAELQVFKHIRAADKDDRVYLQTGFFPQGGVEDFQHDTAEQWDWLKTIPRWQGCMIELPVLPQCDNTVRIELTPVKTACTFNFYLANSGMPREFYFPAAGTDAAPAVATHVATADQRNTIEFVLPSKLLAGREQVMLFYVARDAGDPQKQIDVEFHTHGVEVLVEKSPETDRLIAYYRALEQQRLARTKITLTADSMVKPETEFQMTVVAWTPGGYPDTGYRGKLRLFSNSANLVLPAELEFTEADAGVKSIAGLRCATDGAYLVHALPSDSDELSWRSNYIVCDSQSPYQLLWGDLHVHTQESDGSYSLDATYKFARDITHLNFISINDHDQWRWQEKWELQQQKAKEYDAPGKFAVILGIEWTSPFRGHRNVWFDSFDVPNFYGVKPAEFYKQSVQQLYEQLKPHGAILCTHHLHPKNDYSEWNAEREPCVEIYSVWGNSEEEGRPEQTSILYNGQRVQQKTDTNSAINLLNRGLKVGFLANSDTHTSTPGANVPHNYRVGVSPYRRPGISAVWAKDCTRESVMEAIRNRRCYGAMNERIIIDFKLNDAMMGQEIALDGPRAKAHIRVWGTDNITGLSLIRNGEAIYTPIRYGERDHVDLEFTDRRVPVGDSYYFVQVQQLMEGEYVNAWSSPIWVHLAQSALDAAQPEPEAAEGGGEDAPL